MVVPRSPGNYLDLIYLLDAELLSQLANFMFVMQPCDYFIKWGYQSIFAKDLI